MKPVTVAATWMVTLAALGAGGCGAAGGQTPPPAASTADELLRRIAAAYRDVPALVDQLQIDVTGQQVNHRADGQVVIGAGTDAQVTIEGFRITALDKQFYVERLDRPGKYISTALQGDLIRSFQALSGTALAVPQCQLRYAGEPREFLAALGLSRMQQPRISGSGRAEHKGRPVDELRLEGDLGATAKALADPKTGLLVALDVSAGGFSFSAAMAPQPADKLSQPIKVSTDGRRRVESIQQLVSLGEGDPAPPFKLEALDGSFVTLADLRGQMVVLDFWATWCGPCQMALPRLQEFANWAKDSGKPITVLAVNTGERVAGREARMSRTGGFWKSKGFTMTCLVDVDDSVAIAYSADGLPYSVVVGPDGLIANVEVGFNPGLGAHLKELALRLLP